ncbi:hypothetical protein HN911_11700 [Candidatus Bathyarchaeota archaeon]|jgi:hypothetical protein|nr:hypothetical protein [Candidatus Bathyarchaeota archaeon]
MQEFTLPIQQALVNGLRPRNDVGRNVPYLVSCDRAQPTEQGLIPSYGLVDPYGSSQFDSWPWPQLIRGSEVTFSGGEDAINIVNETNDPWTNSSGITGMKFYDPSANFTLTPTGVWHLVDFGLTWMLLNGNDILLKTNREGMIGDSNTVFGINEITVQTGCAHRGRAILGGFDPSDFWKDEWKAIFDEWIEKSELAIDPTLDIRDNFVWWTSIGGGDLLSLFDPPVEYIEMFRRNEMGFMPMPSQGSVLAVKSLGKNVAVYSLDGVYLLFPVSEPFPTFGLQKVLDHGIPQRGAVGGDEDVHCFVDQRGDAWRWPVDSGPQKLGYKEYLSDMVDQEMVISYDPQENWFYISGEDGSSNILSFVLTSTGLGTTKQQLTGVVSAEGQSYSVYDLSAATTTEIVVQEVDFHFRDLKTLTTVEVGGVFGASDLIYVGVDYRYENDDGWTTGAWVLCNREGFGRVQITALEFRVKVKINDVAGFKIDYINAHWQASGRRTMRGPSADQAGI